MGALKVKDRDKTRADLLAPCEWDTWAMVKPLERLRELAGPLREPWRSTPATQS